MDLYFSTAANEGHFSMEKKYVYSIVKLIMFVSNGLQALKKFHIRGFLPPPLCDNRNIAVLTYREGTSIQLQIGATSQNIEIAVNEFDLLHIIMVWRILCPQAVLSMKGQY